MRQSFCLFFAELIAGAEGFSAVGGEDVQSHAVVKAVWCAAEVFQGDGLAFQRYVDLQVGVAVVGVESEAELRVF